jgi:hypothetical protein
MNNLDNLDKIEKFLKRHELMKRTQEEIIYIVITSGLVEWLRGKSTCLEL